MGKTADLTVVQKTIINNLHKEGNHKHSLPKKLSVHRVLYPSMLTESLEEGKSVEEKDAQPRIWVNFTRNGLRLGSRHKEPPRTDVSRNLATVVVRGVLPGLRRRTGLLPSGPKSSFQMRASFVFDLETKILESGGKVEKLIAQVAWSPVSSFHSLWWFGVQSFLLLQLFKYADFIFQQDLAPAHTAKSTKIWFNDHVLLCLIGQQTHQTWTPERIYGLL